MLRGSTPIQLSQLDITPAIQAAALEQQAAVNLATGIQQGIQNFQAKKEEKKQQQMTASLLKQYLPGADDQAVNALARDKDLRNNFFDFLGAQSMARAQELEYILESQKLSPELEKQIIKSSITPMLGDAAQARINLDRSNEGIALLNKGVKTGSFEDVKLEGKKFINNFLGGGFDVADQETFGMRVGPIMQQYIAETKGAVSDREFATFQSWSAGLTKDPESNRRSLEVVKNMAERVIRINEYYAKLLSDPSNDTRKINLKLTEFIRKESIENPIVPKEFLGTRTFDADKY